MIFSASLPSTVNASSFTPCIYLNNQPWITIPTLFYLNLDEYNQGFSCNPFMTDLNRCNGICNTIHGPSGKIFSPNKKICKFIPNCYKTLEIRKKACEYDLHEL